MITNTIIDLTNQIDVLQKIHDTALINFGLGFIAMFIGIVFGFTLLINSSTRPFSVTLFIVGGLGVTLIFLAGYDLTTNKNTIDQLIEKRADLVRSGIQQMSCEGIRLDILSIMENKITPDFIFHEFEYEKDYYYHKCEIPLRDEVLKLQKEKIK